MTMNYKSLILTLSASALALASCNREEAWSGDIGYLTAEISQDFSVDVVKTKGLAETDEPFRLKIYRGNELVNEVADHRTLVENPLTLKTYTYKVVADNRDEVPAVFDSPRYAGTNASVKIVKDEVKIIDINCALTDVLVEPSFAADIDANFTDWSLTVSNGEGSLVWSKTNGNVGKTGYFQVPASKTLTWTFTGTNLAGTDYTASDSYENVQAKQKYALAFKVEKVDETIGAGAFRLVLDDTMSERSFDFVLDLAGKRSIINGSSPWAKFADVTGSWSFSETPESIEIQYKKAGEAEWTKFNGEVSVNAAKKSFSARLTGLEPATTYEVRSVTSLDKSDTTPLKFTTETAEILPYMGFDDWYMNGSAPMPGVQGEAQFWDTANPGSASTGTVPTNPESSHVAVAGEGKKAAKLESMTAMMGIFAAGNIYTGKFEKAIISLSNPGAKLDWGVPFSSRPLALKGYFDYNPVAISNANAPYTHLKGVTDTCQIQIFLTDWTEAFHINTQEKKFVDVNSNDVIAYGKLESGVTTSTKEGLVNGYEPFTIKLQYRDTTRKPSMIVIVAAASKYGDYFTGGKGSVLYLDEFSFVYDPDEL